MHTKRYFFHDFETGGYENTSILSYYAQVTDENFNKVRELELYFRPDDGIYKVQIQALNYNKINLLEHDAKAISTKICVQKILRFLDPDYSESQWLKYHIVGHNVNWDNAHLKTLIGEEMFRKRFHKPQIDTATLALVMQHKKLLPEHFEISLRNLAEHFGCLPKISHEAKADVETTINVLRAMLPQV